METTGDVLTTDRPQTLGAELVRYRRQNWLLAWLAFLPIALLRVGTLADSDVFWQIRTGLTTLEQRSIPATDTYSWTAIGEPWTLNSWAFNVAVALAYRVAGLAGVAIMCAALMAAAAWLILILARRLGASPAPAAVLLIACSLVMMTWFTARPHLVDYVALLALVLLLERVRVAPRPAWGLVALVVLAALWVNLHAAALLGVGVAAAATCAAGVMCRRRVGRLALATLACAVGAAANPYGLGLIGQSFAVKEESTELIFEWRHLDPTDWRQALLFAFGLLGLWLAARRRSSILAAALAVTAAGSITAIRFLPMLALLAVPVIASALSTPKVIAYLKSRRVILYIGAAALAVTALPACTHLGRPHPATYPIDAVVAAIPAGCRMFNSYTLGGYVLFRRPDVSVSMDSRNDLYGQARLTRMQRVIDGRSAWGLERADCVLVEPRTSLSRRLARDDAWRLSVQDKAAVLYVRTGQ